ncbi:MAG TPA: prepilin-type N-terminal cleavage/methylation domain-containing protein [Candidatus Paceibacterota bacterium]|nr:prepilin-type N-terminal cleavage/methylation domain-containing protein [Candidatus Paceibacterota bacterium]
MMPNSNKGFTMIESLVAIAILLIAVLGPMSLLSKAIADSSYARNQVIATYLAQEGLELVISERNEIYAQRNVLFPQDADLEGEGYVRGTNWLTGHNPYLGDETYDGLKPCIENSSGCIIDGLVSIDQVRSCGSTECEALLFQDGSKLYQYERGDVTPFKRTIKITPIETRAGSGEYKQAKVDVSVKWNNRDDERTFALSSYVSILSDRAGAN